MTGPYAEMFKNIVRDPDPMRLVQEARERGEEPKLVTGVDVGAGADSLVVGWLIPSTSEFVIEGVISDA